MKEGDILANNGFISDVTLDECQKLVDLCFEGNAILDNIVYAMNILPLNTPKLYEFVHYSISHALPTTFADKITDYLLMEGSPVHRGAIPIHDKEYTDLISCFEDIQDIFLNIKKQVELTIDTAATNKDDGIEDFLRSFNVDIVSLYLKQSIVLLNAVKQYDEAGILPSFNKEFESYIIIEK